MPSTDLVSTVAAAIDEHVYVYDPESSHHAASRAAIAATLRELAATVHPGWLVVSNYSGCSSIDAENTLYSWLIIKASEVAG